MAVPMTMTSAAGVSFAESSDLGGVVDIGEQFISGVNDTSDNIFPRCR